MADRDHERGEPEIATTTLAEIYVQQGLLDRALAIYRRVADRSPGDPRVAVRVVEIERQIEQLRASGEPASAPPELRPEPVPTSGERRAAPAAAADPEFLAWLERR